MKTILTAILAALAMNISHAQGQAPVKLRSVFQGVPSPDNSIPYGANPKAGHYANAGDARIYYEVYGKGRPFVILHGGILGSTYDMREFIESLSKNYKVIAVTTRGHGKSETGTASITYDQAVNDAMSVVKETTTATEPVTLLGFSAGGYVAYGVAAKYPEKIDKLIVIGAGEILPISRSFNFSQESGLKADRGYWEQQRALNPEPQKLDRYLAEFNTMFNSLTISKAEFSSIKCPTLVITGEKDELPLKINAYQMIQKGQLAVVPNAGHMVFWDNFPAVWASMVPFLVGK